MVSRALSHLTYPFRRFWDRRPPGRVFLGAAWVALLLLAAGMHFARVAVAPLPSRDSELYIYWAESIAGTSWEEALRTSPRNEALCKPPLLLAAMVWGVRAGFEAKVVGMTLMLLAFLLLCAALALIAEELWRDWRLTLTALLLAAVCPVLVKYSAQILRDPLYWCVSAWALYFAMRASNGRLGVVNWLGCAVCTALAILIRREGIEFVVIFPAWIIAGGWTRGAWRRILVRKIAVVVGFWAVVALAVLPVEHRMAQLGSTWRASQFSFVQHILRRLK